MTSRFWDDDVFGAIDTEPVQPLTVKQLLVRLNVAKSSRSVQESTIAGWLEHNDPNVNLRSSMKDAGFLGNKSVPA